jgi:glycosyltransferase involved in cell wall biosynthesis
VVTAAGDIRIRYHHLDRNRGRGYARQKALEVAQGKYVCWLDGDDWIFPEKLETQLDLLLREPELAAVSTGMAVVNESLDLVGIRVSSNDSSVLHDRVRSVGGVPLVFAASMMRADLAKRTGFVSSYTLSEDTDFLLRALFGKPYAIINTPLYVYREVGCTSLANALASLNACCDIYWNFRRGRTLERLAAVAATRLKQVVYCGATAIGKWDYIIARRSRPPLESERQRYEDALHALMTSRQRNET